MNAASDSQAKPGLHDAKMILAYHEVMASRAPYLYRVTIAQFQEHVSLFVASDASSDTALPMPAVTFDDGHRSNFDSAYPVLEQMGLKATFFILAGCVSTTGEYITWSQARQMLATGHEIQSHGWSHRMLTLCNPRELQDEIVRSKQEMEDRLGVPVTSFSMPGGRWNDRVIAACAAAGYTSVFHSNPWAKPKTLHGVRVRGRFTVTNRMDAPLLRQQMQIGSAARFYLRTRYAAKERVRRMLGDRLYHQLWRWFARFDPQDGMEVHVSGDASASNS